MKLTIERAALLKSLGHVQSVVERRNTIPILSNVKLEAGDGAVRLNATDMDLDIVEQAVADVATPGSTTVSAHTLYDIVRKLPDGAQVNMDGGGDGQVILSAGRSRFTLASLPIPDFSIQVDSHLVMLDGQIQQSLTLISSPQIAKHNALGKLVSKFSKPN